MMAGMKDGSIGRRHHRGSVRKGSRNFARRTRFARSSACDERSALALASSALRPLAASRYIRRAMSDPPPPAAATETPRPYLAGLNEGQRQAVEAIDGPVLVLAGAGTGKTRVLTTRLAHVLATRRAWPSQILAVTFTNKAALEMRERIGALIGPSAEGLRWLGTFHSIAAQILRRHAELVGLKSSYTILDTDDQERLIKQVLEAENIDSK